MIALLISRHANISIFISSAVVFWLQNRESESQGSAYVIALQNFSISLEVALCTYTIPVIRIDHIRSDTYNYSENP